MGVRCRMRILFRRVAVGIVVSLAVAVGAAWFVADALSDVVAAQREATEVARFLGRLDRVLLTVVGAETRARGFAITGDVTYLSAFERSVERFPFDLAAARETAGGAPYADDLDRVAEAFDAYVADQAEALIDARQQHPPRELLDGMSALASWMVADAVHGTWLDAPHDTTPPVAVWSDAVASAEDSIMAVLALPLPTDRRSVWSDLALDVRSYRLALFGPEARPDAFAETAIRAAFTGVGTGLAVLVAEAERAETQLAELLLTGEGREWVPRIREVIATVSEDATARLDTSLVAATQRYRSATTTAWAAPVVAVLVALATVVAFLFDVGRHVLRLGGATRALAEGEPVAAVGEHGPAALRPFTRDFDRMVGSVQAREIEAQEIADLAAVLQAARSVEESLQAVSDTVSRLLPHAAGSVWLVDAARVVMFRTVAWGEVQPGSVDHVDLDACWALRQGRTFVASDVRSLRCAHDETSDGSTTCVPLVSRDDTLGVLSLHRPSPGAPVVHEQRLMRVVAEQLALALVNIRLRGALEQQSIRDPLTGLFNRRFLEHAFALEVHRAERTGKPLAAIMLDVDHFKPFNDTHGHEAGDAVLRAVGHVLTTSVRSGDIACRFGGEEFMLLLPGADEASALARAEVVRVAIADETSSIEGRSLPGVTASLGVAVATGARIDAAKLTRAADEALYAAKRSGRDRVSVAAFT